MTNPTPHLCAILARGEPLFVVAEPMDIAGEEGWIISFGGWRVYPWWTVPLYDIDDRHEISPNDEDGLFTPCFVGVGDAWRPGAPPEDWPDSIWKDGNDRAASFVNEAEARPLLEKIGLVKPKEPLRRRV